MLAAGEGGLSMIVTKLAVAAFVMSVAMEPILEPRDRNVHQLSLHQRNVVVQPYQRRATECIVREVTGDERFRVGNLGELIVELMPKCVDRMRSMIEAYDRNFGEGAGEAFFMGPYLDLLPKVIVRRINSTH
jgi:hypothetical protein